MPLPSLWVCLRVSQSRSLPLRGSFPPSQYLLLPHSSSPSSSFSASSLPSHLVFFLLPHSSNAHCFGPTFLSWPLPFPPLIGSLPRPFLFCQCPLGSSPSPFLQDAMPSRLLSLPLPLFFFTFLLSAAFSSLFASALLFSFLGLLLLPLSPSHFPPYWLLLHLPLGFSPASTNSSPPPQRLPFPLSICNPPLPSTLSLVFLHNLPFWTHTLIVVFLKYIPTILCYPSLIWSHTLTPLIHVNPLWSPGSSLCKHSVIYF